MKYAKTGKVIAEQKQRDNIMARKLTISGWKTIRYSGGEINSLNVA